VAFFQGRSVAAWTKVMNADRFDLPRAVAEPPSVG
jgi:hypothetical protein